MTQAVQNGQNSNAGIVTTLQQIGQQIGRVATALANGALGGSSANSILSTSFSAAGISSPANTSENTLMSYSMPANTIGSSGRGIRIFAQGSYAANSDSKQVRIRLGSAMAFSPGAVTTSGVTWSISGTIWYNGANVQIGFFTYADGVSAHAPVTITGAETTTGALTVALTAQTAGTGGDVLANGLVVEYLS